MTSREPTRVKRDRDEVFVEFTRSICPLCKQMVDAQVNIRDGKVYLRKRCRDHGEFEALVYGDAQMYLDAARFNKPGTIPLQFQTEVRDGCPADPADERNRRYVEGQRLYLAACDPAARATLVIDNTDPAHPRVTRTRPRQEHARSSDAADDLTAF